ncbi:MAG: type II secretion system protein GspG [Candidatus Kaelpia aquatica]|nr:type II secretion system protein GspG [Candidatus Kaelpia aquatica]
MSYLYNKIKGVTLMELIVVIIIMGVLAGLLTPLAVTTIRRAKISNAESKLHALGEALRLYYECNFDLPASDLTDLSPEYIRSSEYSGDYAYDAWRKAIVYTKSDSKNATLVSYGPNRISGGDDITYNVSCSDIYRNYHRAVEDELIEVNKAVEDFVRDGYALSSSITSESADFSTYLIDSDYKYDNWGIRGAPGEDRAAGEPYHYDETKQTFYSYGPDGADDSCSDDDILPEGMP